MSRTEFSYQVIHCITKIAVDLSAYIHIYKEGKAFTVVYQGVSTRIGEDEAIH